MRLLLLLTLLAASAFGQKVHGLKATKETVQWGWLDPKETPKLTVDSGELVRSTAVSRWKWAAWCPGTSARVLHASATPQ